MIFLDPISRYHPILLLILFLFHNFSLSMLSHVTAGDHSMSAPPSDPVALMEFYMKKAAQEERQRPPRQSKDEMPPPPCLVQGTFLHIL
jgi:hypothetical protein